MTLSFTDVRMLKRWHTGPVSPHVDGFVSFLQERGYARLTVRSYLGQVGHLSRWLDERRLEVNAINEAVIKRFVQHRRRQGHAESAKVAIFRLLLEYLRGSGAICPAACPADASAGADIRREFARHLSRECGLSNLTVRHRVPIIRQFLARRFGNGPVRVQDLQPRDITAFVLHRARVLTPASAKNVVAALRSFFRFLRQSDRIATDLAACVPTVAQRRLSGLPRPLTASQVRDLLAACDRSTLLGRRDYSILLLLARLGLRAGEIVGLTLDDIDWQAGELTIRGKGSQQDRLPLPRDVGEAIVEYLREGRPQCPIRRVFIRVDAPRGGFASSAPIWSVVRRALARCGLNACRGGAHLLRHALATQMLRRGASLAEIAEILRHRHLNTTQIYAKVDLPRLSALALPWPGGVR